MYSLVTRESLICDMGAYIDYCVWYFSKQGIGHKGGWSWHVLQW